MRPASRGLFPQIPAFEGRCSSEGFVAPPHRIAAGTLRPGASPEAAHRPSRCTASSATDPWRPERSRACSSHGEPRTEPPLRRSPPEQRYTAADGGGCGAGPVGTVKSIPEVAWEMGKGPWLAGDSTPLRSRPFARSLPVPLAGLRTSLHRPLRGTPRIAPGPWCEAAPGGA